jgi:outer membrane lipoprotein-sorting protein
VVLVPLFAVPACGQAVDELLDQLEKRREQVGTLYHVTKNTSREGDLVRESVIRTWEKRSGKTYKARVLSTTKTGKKSEKSEKSEKSAKDSGEVETLTVSDGEYEWRQTQINDKIMVFKSKASRENPLKVLREAARGGQVRLTGREHIEHQPCVVLEVKGERARDQSKATYWVSESHGAVLRSKTVRMDGGEVEVTTSEFKVAEPIEDDKFVYAPPEGAVVIDTDAIGGQPDKQTKP